MVSTMSKIREAWTLANKRSPSVRAKREGAERRYDAGRPASMGPATKGGKKQVNRFLVYPVPSIYATPAVARDDVVCS